MSNSKHVFLMVLDPSSLRSRCWEFPHLLRAGFVVHRKLSFLCVLMRQKEGNDLSGVSFIRVLIPHDGSALMI